MRRFTAATIKLQLVKMAFCEEIRMYKVSTQLNLKGPKNLEEDMSCGRIISAVKFHVEQTVFNDFFFAITCITGPFLYMQARLWGNRLNVVIVSEGAVDANGKSITSQRVKNVICEKLDLDTRITVLGK